METSKSPKIASIVPVFAFRPTDIVLVVFTNVRGLDFLSHKNSLRVRVLIISEIESEPSILISTLGLFHKAEQAIVNRLLHVVEDLTLKRFKLFNDFRGCLKL